MLDQRKRPIRGLWRRNDRYYAQLTVEDPNTGVKRVKRVPLEEAKTDAQAVAKLQELLTQRRKGSLPVLKRTPKFADYAQTYFDYYKQAKDAKRQSTLYTERLAINNWNEHLGHIRVDRITRAMVNSYIAKRQAAGLTGRTVNLEVICFRNVMKRAIDDGWIMSLPTLNLRPLKWTPRKRQLVSGEDIDRLCKAAIAGAQDGEKFKNGQLFADYVRLMAYCGSRRSETLRLKWLDVDWQNHQLTIGSDGLAKNHQARVVDFNPKLAALLPTFGFHDCRHFFISMCVMSGIDFMTIARWVGHQDGGVLIGKVYGHLSNEHAKRQAQKVDFGPEASVDTSKPEVSAGNSPAR